MLNKGILNETYKNLISYKKEKFSEDIKYLKNRMNFKSLESLPLLIYSKNKRNALYYILCNYFSLKNGRVLTYSIITGQSLLDQHFASNENKDYEVLDGVLYSDISFISINQYDYINEYLEAQIINIIESRNQSGRLTIITIDVLEPDKPYSGIAKKLKNYFVTNSFQVLDLVGSHQPSRTTNSHKTKQRIM